MKIKEKLKGGATYLCAINTRGGIINDYKYIKSEARYDLQCKRE